MNYKQIKQLLDRERKKPQKDRLTRDDLLVMSKNYDPFYAGMPSRKKAAEWFAEVWKEYGGQGYHLRRLHYKIISQIKTPGGKVYQNTKDDWEFLLAASVNARHLNLVSYDEFVDRRNPPPKVIIDYNNDSLCDVCREPVEAEITGLDGNRWAKYNLMQLRDYRLEVWAEKSTMDDILIPLCERYGIFLITGAGFESLTHINDLLRRIQQFEKPCRIFYISDYDSAGQNMPRQVGRQLQYRIEKMSLQGKVDIKLKPIILLKDQVEKYQLPCAPGQKATELDALEALHPGEFEKIVKLSLDEYIDLEKAREFKSQQDDKIRESNDKIDEIIYSEFQDEIDDLENEIKELEERISQRIEDIQVEKVGKPDPKEITEENGWLFESDLDYFDQLEKFKRYENEQNP